MIDDSSTMHRVEEGGSISLSLSHTSSLSLSITIIWRERWGLWRHGERKWRTDDNIPNKIPNNDIPIKGSRSNTPIWTQTPLSKVGVLPLCRMGCLCSGTFWTGRNSWRKKSISMEFQNFHARVAEKFHPTFHLHKCIVPTYNLRERTDDSQADVTSSLLSQCLFSYINHEGITLVGKGNGVLPLRFRTQYLSRC